MKKIFSWSFLSYFYVLCLVPLLSEKDDHYTQFHAKQGLLFAIAETAVGFSWIFSKYIPVFGKFTNFVRFGGLISVLMLLFCIFITVLGTFHVLKGHYYRFPIVGKYIERVPINCVTPEV